MELTLNPLYCTVYIGKSSTHDTSKHTTHVLKHIHKHSNKLHTDTLKATHTQTHIENRTKVRSTTAKECTEVHKEVQISEVEMRRIEHNYKQAFINIVQRIQ